MATLERTRSFLQARENFSERNYKDDYEASQREVNILKTKLETNSKKMEDYKISMENKLYLLTEEHTTEKEGFEKLKKEYEDHITSLENILHHQENEQARLLQTLDETEEDASDYLEQIDDLKRQLEDQGKDIDSLHSENQKLFDMTAQLQDDNVRLQSELSESEEIVANHNKQVKAKLATAMEEFEQQMKEGNKKSLQKDETIFHLNEELERCSAENQHLRISIVTLNEQVASLEALLLEQEKDHLRIKTLYSSHEFAITKLTSEYESVQQQLDLKTRSSDASESKVDRLQLQLNEATNELTQCQERIKSLEVQLKEVQAKSVTDRTNLSNKLLAALDDWNDRIAFVNGQLQQKDELIATQKKQLDAKLSELYSVRQELNKLKNGSGSTGVTPVGSPAKVGAPPHEAPSGTQRELSNTWTQLKNQLADYQSTSALSSTATTGGVAMQFIPPAPPAAAPSSSSGSSGHGVGGKNELKRSPSSKWTLNGLNNGQPHRTVSALEEESTLPAPPVPHYALSRSVGAASSGTLHTPVKATNSSASGGSGAATAPTLTSTPGSALATSSTTSLGVGGVGVNVVSSSPGSLHKAQSMVLAPRSTSPSRTKSPERTKSTLNVSGGASAGSYAASSNYMNRSMSSSVGVESRARSPAKLTKSASIGADRLR